MTQFEFELICKLIQAGAPALAENLITGLTGVINTANEAIRERDALKAELEAIKSEPCDCDKTSAEK